MVLVRWTATDSIDFDDVSIAIAIAIAIDNHLNIEEEIVNDVLHVVMHVEG